MTNQFDETLFNETLTVTQVTSIIKELLEGAFPRLTLEGEISNWRPSSSGHIYFSLKDENSVISAVMFRGNAAKLNFTPRDGNLVRVTGNISVYAARGNYQIIVATMEEAGAGAILRMLEERKQKFLAEGLFDETKKKPLPFFPRTIAVVTSHTGAALQDILNITRRRNPLVSVTVLPCQVQGAEAGVGIASQINTANKFNLGDVIIVGRGGGSLEDLLPFSDECVVRAIAASRLPVISAVGHEIDWALSDFVADVRAPTPSAAAELATPLLSEIINKIDREKNTLQSSISSKLEHMKALVKGFSPESMELRFRNISQPLWQRFDDAKEDLLLSMQNRIDDAKKRIQFATIKLEMGNPASFLARGYSMVRDVSTGKIIRSPADTNIGQKIEIIPATGKILATVDDNSIDN